MNPGDKVTLNGYSFPLMVIEFIDGTKAKCVWFHQYELKCEVFELAMLTLHK